MAIPREPRQKMINMMYLVLTALLALNVSSEILNAFKVVNSSLEKTNEVVSASTGDVMTSLQAKLTDAGTAEKAKYWLPKAQQVQSISKVVDDYIKDLKGQILKGANFNAETGRYKEDNLDVATRIMVEKGGGKTLLQKLTDYRTQIFAVDPAIATAFKTSLPINLDKPPTKNKGNNTWEAAYFRMVPTVAAITILSKFQNDVKTAENKVVTFCHEQVGKVEFRFNAYEPVVGQNAKVLLPNQELEITAALAAFNTDSKPDVFIAGKKIELNAKGLAVWKTNVSASGKIPVRVEFTTQDGKKETKTFDVEYEVGQSNAAVQLDKMNVLFIGVENPVTVSGSGSADKLKVGISGGGGTLSGGNGKYIARVNQETDNCIISVTTPEGKTTPMKFRVRSIPDPTPMVGTRKSGEFPAGEFKSQAGVRAIVENFFYETQFNVTQFRITGDGSGFDDGIEEANNTGAAWNESRRIIGKCRPGTFITIEDIYAVGPDGRRRKLTPLIYNLK